MDLSYSAQKKSALTELNPEYLRDWALAIPAPRLHVILDQLPPMKGFRPGKDGPVRLLTYFGRMNRWSQDDWLLLGRIWVHWTQAHPPIDQGLGVTTTEQIVKLAQEMVEIPDSRRKALINLVSMTRSSSLTQELIRTWYDTGPFPPDPEIIEIVSMAQTSAEAAIPGRLMAIEQKTGQLDDSYQGLYAELKSVSEQVRSLTKLPGIVTGLEPIVRSSEERIKQLSGRLSELEEALGGVSKSQDAQDNSILKTRSEVASLQPQLLSLSSRVGDWGGFIDSFTQDRSELTESMSNLTAQWEHIQGEVERLDLAVQAQGSRPQPSTTESVIGLTTGPRPLVHDVRTIEPVELDNVANASEHLARNLNLLGIKLPQAQSLSLDVLAALGTGQIVTFTGSLAGVVAERCALSLASADLKLVRIPVGLIDGETLNTHLECWMATADCSVSPVGVLIDGANCSALEIYGTSLQRFVTERILGLTGRGLQLFLFASLIDGPSTVPYGKGLLELGPLFDTDALGWLDSPSQPAIPGSLRPEGWSSSISDTKIDWEQSWVPDWFSRKSGALWRRALAKAALFRSAMTPRSTDSDQMIPPELAFGWVLPMALLICPQEVNIIIERVKLDIRGSNLLQLKGVEVGSE